MILVTVPQRWRYPIAEGLVFFGALASVLYHSNFRTVLLVLPFITGFVAIIWCLRNWRTLGKEYFELSPETLLYRSGVWPVRRFHKFEWQPLRDVQVANQYFNIGLKYEQAPWIGMGFGIGVNLTLIEATQMVQLLQLYPTWVRTLTAPSSPFPAKTQDELIKVETSEPTEVTIDPQLLTDLGDSVEVLTTGSKITLKISDRNQRLLLYIVGLPIALFIYPILLGLLWAMITGRFNPGLRDGLRLIILYATVATGSLGVLAKVGPQIIELSPTGFRYRAGRGPFRMRPAFPWDGITNLQLNPRPGFTRPAITFIGITGPRGGPVGIASNLMGHAAPTLLKILQQYQAAALRTPALKS